MGIVNAGALPIYDDIPKDLLKLVEDCIFNRAPDATDKYASISSLFMCRLLAYAENSKKKAVDKSASEQSDWRLKPVNERLTYSLVKGMNI